MSRVAQRRVVSMLPGVGNGGVKRRRRRAPPRSVMRGRRRLAVQGLGIENKYLDVYATATALTAPADCSGGEIQPTGGCTGCLSSPAQGDTSQNRDGKKIIISSCFVSGFLDYTVQTDKNDPTVAPTVFVALVQDKQTNKATIVSENVFTNPVGASSCNARPLRNMSYTQRYNVLATATIEPSDVIISTDGANTCSNDANGRPFVLSWRGQIPVSFDTAVTTANVTGVIDNSLHIIAYCTSTTGSLPVLMTYNSRIRFQG